MKTIQLNGYTIKASSDVDGHLTLTVDHEDESQVNDTGCDCSLHENQFAVRLTTEAIETKFKKDEE